MKNPFPQLNTLVSGVILPSLTLAGCIFAFKMLGVTKPSERPAASQSLAARMERLAAAQAVAVKPLSKVDGLLDIEVDGEVVPFREIELATEVAGKVVFKSPNCEAGNYVRKDEVLFRIDKTDTELEVERLEKQKQQEYESLREIDQEITNTEKLISVAKQDETLREKEITRLEELPSGFASETEIDAAKQSRLQALNTRIGYENQLALLKKKRNKQEAIEQVIDSQLRLARKNLERTEIKSPVDGVVFREDAELNSFVQRGTVIVTLEDTSKAEVAVNLRMDQLFWVLDQKDTRESGSGTENNRLSYQLPRTKATIRYNLNGRDAVYEWDGWLERYDGIGVDAKSRMVPVRVIVDSPGQLKGSVDSSIVARIKGPKALVRGMFVQVMLHVQPKTPLVLVPNLALQPGNRLWKFSADPGVLDVKSEPAASKPNEAENSGTKDKTGKPSAKLTASVTEGSGTGENAQTFNPAAWQAGRLTILQNVTSITSVELPPESGRTTDKAMLKYWICEVPDGSLKSGDYVVVTPLGGLAGDGSDLIRVPASDIDD